MLDRGHQQPQMMPGRANQYGPPLYQNFGTNPSYIEPSYNSSSTASMVRPNAWEPSPDDNAKINQNRNKNNVTTEKEPSV
jgi:hypothetical protein